MLERTITESTGTTDEVHHKLPRTLLRLYKLLLPTADEGEV